MPQRWVEVVRHGATADNIISQRTETRTDPELEAALANSLLYTYTTAHEEDDVSKAKSLSLDPTQNANFWVGGHEENKDETGEENKDETGKDAANPEDGILYKDTVDRDSVKSKRIALDRLIKKSKKFTEIQDEEVKEEVKQYFAKRRQEIHKEIVSACDELRGCYTR